MARRERPGQQHRRGHRGGAILQHRAIWSLRLPKRRLTGGTLIAGAFTLLLVGAQHWVAEFWSWQMLWWMRALELPGQFEPAVVRAPNWLSLPAPLIDVQLPAFGPLSAVLHALVAVAVWQLAGRLPDSAKPGAYLLRFAVLIHGAAALYFMAWPASFAHPLLGHIAGGLRQSWMLMLLAPWLHLCTYYLFPFPAWQNVALTALTLLFLLVLAPLQYATHAAVIYLLGLIMMPLLYLLFGVMVPILGFVALYGWGMSWHDPAREPREA